MTKLLNSLNLDVGESIVIDVLFETEDFNDVAQAMSVDPSNLLLKKFIYTLPLIIIGHTQMMLYP